MRNNRATARRAATVALMLFLLLSLAAACQPSPAPAPPAPAPQPGAPQTAPATVGVTLAGFAFVPDSITIPAGATVTWRNDDGVPHTVTANAGRFDSGTLSRGQSFSYTFDQKGSYDYHCAIHPGMTGKVIVQ